MKPTITIIYNESQKEQAKEITKNALAGAGRFTNVEGVLKQIFFYNTQDEVKGKLYSCFIRLRQIHKDEKNLSEILTISKDFGMLTYKGVKAILVFQPLNK